jgi:Mn-dependent DtxR family transcriptional regulator
MGTLESLHKLGIIEPIKDGSYKVTEFGMEIYEFIESYLHDEHKEKHEVYEKITIVNADIAIEVSRLASAYYESTTLKSKIKFLLEEKDELERI